MYVCVIIALRFDSADAGKEFEHLLHQCLSSTDARQKQCCKASSDATSALGVSGGTVCTFWGLGRYCRYVLGGGHRLHDCMTARIEYAYIQRTQSDLHKVTYTK